MTFTCVVTRPELALADLNINDHTNYYVSNDSILNATVSMRRNTVTSPYVESAFHVNAVRDIVQDNLAVEVMSGGGGQVGLQNNMKALIAAFQGQMNYNISFTWDSATYTYACQSADYSVDWSNTRPIQQQLKVTFTLQRSPVPINGF